MSGTRFISLVLFLFVAYRLSGQETAENDGYEIVRQDEKITMYERWIPYPGTKTNSRQIKCVFYSSTNLDNMFAYINEEAKIVTWQKNIIEYKVIPQTDSTWVAYSHYKIPWPLTNQDYLLAYSLIEKNEKRMVFSFKHLADEKLGPIRADVDRRPTTGQWVLEQSEKGKIKVTYVISSLPLSYPRFITDRIVHNSLMSTLNTLLTVVEK